MSVRLRPYGTYKTTDLPWLQAIPEHWRLQRIDHLFKLRNETPLPSDLRVTAYLDGRVTLRSNIDQKIKGVIHEAGWQRIHPGDFAISGMNAHLGGMGVSDALGKCSPIYLVLEPRSDTNAHFVSYAVRHLAQIGALKSLVNTIRFNSADLKRADLKSIRVWIPPTDEQTQIVHFISLVDARLKRLIRAKRRVIELLNEQKQAIIQRAVTRGVDPNVPLKPSGIGLIGNIPEGWEVRRLRTIVTSIDQGVSPQAEAGLAENGAWGVLKAGCVNGGFFRQREHKKLPENFEFDPAIIVRYGDVLVSRACGSPKLVGSVGRVDALNYNLILSDKTFRLNLRDARLAKFIVASMNTPYFRMQVEQAISGAEGLANNLPISSLKDMWIVLPPADQAVELGEQIEHTSRKLNESVATNSQEIDLLLEYRSRLIADVVTGKLDVRSVDLPELEPEDALEPLSRSDGVEFEGIPEENSEAVCEEMGTAE